MDIPTIEAPQIILRAWKRDDEPALFAILHEDSILRYFPNPNPPSRSEVGDYIAHQLTHWEDYGYGHWAVVERRSGQVVGWNGLEYLPELAETEVGYLLSRRVWGRGFATEAARAAVQYGFETAGLQGMTGLVHPENAGSIRVLEKCGMTFADQVVLWGLGLSRYRIHRMAYEEGQQRMARQGLAI